MFKKTGVRLAFIGTFLCLSSLLIFLYFYLPPAQIIGEPVRSKILALADVSSPLNAINISELTEGKLAQLCLQKPYELREQFELMSERIVPNFKLIYEDRFRLWFFFQNGAVRWLDFPVAELKVTFSENTKCAATQPIIMRSDRISVNGILSSKISVGD